MSDSEYIDAIKRCDQKALGELYDNCRPYFVSTIKKHAVGLPLSDQRDYIGDLFNESFMVMFEKAARGLLEEASNLKSYVVGVGLKKHSNNLKKQAVHAKYSNEVLATTSPIEIDFEDERWDVVNNTVEAMKEPCRTILLLFYWDKKNLKEIAEELGYGSEQSAKTQKYKCYTKLAATIKSTLNKLGL